MAKDKIKTLKFAFGKSLPVLFGYLFLGSAFGITLYETGYNWIWAAVISLLVFAGSGQFVLCSLLGAHAPLSTVAMMTLFINSRHIFYGVSFVDKFKKGGWRYPFLIYTLTDETYSVNTSFSTVPDGVNEIHARYLIGLFDHIYWICGSVIGAVAGQLIPIDFSGIEFSMTALFVVIFVDQMRAAKSKMPGLIGIFCALICLFIFGKDRFLLPCLIITVALLSGMKPIFEKEKEVK